MKRVQMIKRVTMIGSYIDYEDKKNMSEEEQIAARLFELFNKSVYVYEAEEVPVTDQSVWARVRDYMPHSIQAAGIEEYFKDTLNREASYYNYQIRGGDHTPIKKIFYDGFRGTRLGNWSYYFFINDHYYVSIKQYSINVYVIHRNKEGLWPLNSRPGYEAPALY